MQKERDRTYAVGLLYPCKFIVMLNAVKHLIDLTLTSMRCFASLNMTVLAAIPRRDPSLRLRVTRRLVLHLQFLVCEHPVVQLRERVVQLLDHIKEAQIFLAQLRLLSQGAQPLAAP